MRGAASPPLVAHIVLRLDYGGLENGLVNLINRMSPTCARHVVIGLSEVTEFASRIERRGVEVHAIGKKPGKDPAAYLRLYKLLRRLKPDVVHTRNIGTLDCQVVAMLAGVERRVHSEHGWDTTDQEGRSGKYRLLRRVLSVFVDQHIALSRELEDWLVDDLGVPRRKVTRICNGVDTTRFKPRRVRSPDQEAVVIGTVTRFSDIKDPLNTLRAFARLRDLVGSERKVCLIMVGDGPLLESVQREVSDRGLGKDVCLPGSQLDVVPWLHRMDLFVMGSRREGISNTILEAMAAGLAVVATRTGGNLELVDEGVTGSLVPPQSADALAAAMEPYVLNDALRKDRGSAGRNRVVREFSINSMVDKYASLYSSATSFTQVA
jgi:sugar transferase (PEP-CTERM/EpsH1 system associated)